MAFEPLSYDELVELWRQLLPTSYTAPLEAEFDGQGFDAFSQQAKQFAWAGEAIAVTQQTYYKLPHSTQIRPEAAGGRAATGTVLIERGQGTTLGEVVLNSGTVLEAVVLNTQGVEIVIGEFALSEFVTLSPGAPGPLAVAAHATRVGYQGNILPDSITRFKLLGRADVTGQVGVGNSIVDVGTPDRFTEDMAGRYVTFGTGPNAGTTPRQILTAGLGTITVSGVPLTPGPQQVSVVEYEDLGLTVTQPAAFGGGVHAWLDDIGKERNLYRQDGETDNDFRSRVCFLADTISPGAVERLCHRILAPCGICCEITERNNAENAFIYDLPTVLAPDIRSPWDDPDAPGNGVLWDSLGTSTRFLQIRVSCSNAGEIGFAFDADPMQPEDDNAWDWPDLGPQQSPPVWDGYAVSYNACVGAFADALRNILAAGVGFEIIQDCSLECACEPAP